MRSKVVPQLGLTQEYEVGFFSIKHLSLFPEVGKTVEGQRTIKHVHGPNSGQLKRTALNILDVLVKALKGENLRIVGTVPGILGTGQPGVVNGIGQAGCKLTKTTVVFYLQSKGRVPELEGTTDFHVSHRNGITHLGIVIKIYKKEGASPLVGFKHFQGGGHITPVFAKVVVYL